MIADLATTADVATILARLDRIEARQADVLARLPPRLLTVREASDALGISPASCWRRIKSGDIPCRRIGRSVRVPAEALHPPTMAEIAAATLEARR